MRSMKAIPLLLGFFLLTLTVHADTIIFRGKLSVRFVGHGSERVFNEKTITIANVDGTNATHIETVVINGHKLYHVDTTPGSVFGTTVRGANGRIYHVSGMANSFTNDLMVVTRIQSGFS